MQADTEGDQVALEQLTAAQKALVGLQGCPTRLESPCAPSERCIRRMQCRVHAPREFFLSICAAYKDLSSFDKLTLLVVLPFVFTGWGLGEQRAGGRAGQVAPGAGRHRGSVLRHSQRQGVPGELPSCTIIFFLFTVSEFELGCDTYFGIDS